LKENNINFGKGRSRIKDVCKEKYLIKKLQYFWY